MEMDALTADNKAGLKRRRETEAAEDYKSMFIHAAEDFPDSDNEEETVIVEIKLTGDELDASTLGTKRGQLWFKKRAETVQEDSSNAATHVDVIERAETVKEDSSHTRRHGDVIERAETVKEDSSHARRHVDVIERAETVKEDSSHAPKHVDVIANSPKVPQVVIQDKRMNKTPSPPPGSLEEMFSKKRTLKEMRDRYIIPTSFYVDRKWKDRELDTLKTHINSTKSLLDELNLEQWHTHTKRMNPAGEVPILLRKKFTPEYCTQAWCKMFECLSNYPVIPKSLTDAACQPGLQAPVPFCSVHLCEAPGAFISATNHFLRTHYNKINWKWLATTLNPYFEGNDVGKMINEDQLMISSHENWTFLKDTTGNIMNEANIDFLKEEVEKKFSGPNGIPVPVSLVTADGSIDCQSFPTEQESVVAKLQFSEIIAALSILSQGGSFVLKIFTFFENQSISHLYILCCAFREVHLFKPATSKEGNSEVYVVCLGYYGSFMFEAELQKLKKLLGGEYDERVQRFSLVQRSLIRSGQFLDRIVGASKFFTLKQDAVIRRNLDHFRLEMGSRYFTSDIMREELAYQWLHRFHVQKLKANCRLFGKDELLPKLKSACHVDPRGESGTFKDKVLRMNANCATKLDWMKKDLTAFADLHNHTDWVTVPFKLQYGNLYSIFAPSEGKKFENILSSRFCFGKPLLLKEEFRQLMKSPLKEDLEGFLLSKPLHIHGPFEKLKAELGTLFPDARGLALLCCGETIQHALFLTDVRKLQLNLLGIIDKLSRIRRSDSMFLCDFPLLSRLHVGIMCALSAFFQSTRICYGLEDKPRGILFDGFIDKAYDGRFNVYKLLNIVLRDLSSSSEFGTTELVPLRTLINLDVYKHIFNYNMCNVICSLNAEISSAQRLFEAKRRTESKRLY